MRRISLIVLAGALLVAPSAGEAAKSKRGAACPDGAVCVWSKANFRGDREVVDRKGSTNLSRDLNNEVTSAKNRTGKIAYLMDARDGSTGDDYQCIFEEENLSDLRELGFDNRVSSVLRPRPGDGRPPC